MSTQYNNFQEPYDYIRKYAIAYMEHENVKTTVWPFIKNAHVLELACGSGFYTWDFLKWGASSVTGVDISQAMIEAARQQGKTRSLDLDGTKGTVDFILADCMKPTAYAGGPFDLVFGAWLLNYAPDRATLVDVFRNIALNLKDGGHFVGVTIVPAKDPLASIEHESKARPAPGGSSGLVYRFLKDVEEGIYFNCRADTPIGEVSFDNYYLREDVYRDAAREAGLKGELSWGVSWVPERWLEGEGPGLGSKEEIESYKTVPNYGLFVVGK